MVHSGLFTAIPFLVGAVVIVIVNWIGDCILTPDAVRAGKRRGVVVVCLILAAGGMAIPYVGSIGAVVALTILPVAFSNTATATKAALASDLLHSPADAGRAFVPGARRQCLRAARADRHRLHRRADRQLCLGLRVGRRAGTDRCGAVVRADPLSTWGEGRDRRPQDARRDLREPAAGQARTESGRKPGRARAAASEWWPPSYHSKARTS